ncbi:DUF2515 family protein [Sessilibacter sp. MAH4]
MVSPESTAGVNDNTDKVEPVEITCKTYWSKAQEFSIIRMSERVGFNEYDLLDWYEVRAKRIAATYARFYLETEEGGDVSKLGRYYWMALGAFASKTVACLLGMNRVVLTDMFLPFVNAKEIADGLGKGNLWLFMDISAPHWFYNNYPEHFFDGMVCIDKRNAKNLEAPIQTVVDSMPWSQKTLPIINNMAISGSLKSGFKYVTQIEKASGRAKRDLQMKHLLEIANHEQGVILQPLIYEHPEFAKWARWQRGILLNWASPSFELVFSHACEIDDGELKSVAPDDMQVENFKSRMDWIKEAASVFHDLMAKRSNYMHGELQKMASWVNTKDYSMPTRAIIE